MLAERDADRREDRALARQAALITRTTVARATTGLLGAPALIEPSGRLPTGAFSVFAREVLRDRALEAVAPVGRISAAQRPAVERLLGRPLQQATPAGFAPLRRGAAEHYVVLGSQPAGSRATVGFDLATDPVRGPVARAARDAGATRLTPPLRLARARVAGFTALKPLYRPGRPVRTVAQRRAALIGFLSSAFRSSVLRGLVRDQLPEGTAIRITDAGRAVMAAGDVHDAARERTTVLGRRWALAVEGPDRASATGPLLVAVGGLVLTGLVGLLFRLAARREREARARAAAERRAREAADAERRRAELLAGIGRRLTGSLEIAATVGAVVELLVPALADVCVVDLAGEDGGLRRVAGVHADPARRPLVGALPVPAVTLAGDGARLLGDGAAPPGWEQLAPGSLIACPLVARERPIGTIVLATTAARAPLDEAALPLVEEIAALCALALENAGLYQAVHRVALTLQRSLLPARLPHTPGVEVAARYVSAAVGTEAGGDWYDVIRLAGGRVGVAVGDVVGRGAPAAATMGQLRSALRAYALEGAEPGAALRALSRFALDVPRALMTTVAYAVLDPAGGELRWACAGHPPPLLLGPDGTATFLEDSRGRPLAVDDVPEHTTTRTPLRPGGTIVLYTDGLVERRAEPLDAGMQRLAATALGARAAGHGAPAALCDRVLAALTDGAAERDDVALVVARTES